MDNKRLKNEGKTVISSYPPRSSSDEIVVAGTKFPQYQNLVFAAQDKNWIKNSIRPCERKRLPSSSLPRSFSLQKNLGKRAEDRPQNLSSSFLYISKIPWKMGDSKVFLFLFKGEKGGSEGERGRGSDKLNILWNFVTIHSDFWGMRGRVREEED